MELHVLRCPNCGANLEVEDGIDTFYCKYCGYKIILDGQSDQAYKSKTRIKGMEHSERMLDKRLEYKKSKDEKKAKENKRGIILSIIMVVFFLSLSFFLMGSSKRESKAEEKQLQQIVEEVQTDIKDGDYNDAYIKAQSVVYTSGYSDDIEEKWNNTRKELINQIIDAEKQATGSSTHKPEK